MNLRTALPAALERNRNFFLSLLNASTTLSHLAQAHAQIIVGGYRNDISTVTKLTHKLCDLRAIGYARDLFLSVSKPDLFLFNVVIKGYSTNGSPRSSMSLFAHLRKNTGLRPDNFTYFFAVSASAGFRDEKVGTVLHSQAIVDGFGFDLFIGSALVDLYLKFSKLELAKKLFDEMPERDTVLWNTMISGLVKNCCFEDSVLVFKDMVADAEIRLDSTSLAAVLPAAGELHQLRVGMGIQSLATKLGLHSHVHILTGLISFYSKCGDTGTATLLFDQIDRPDLVSYNAMISGYTCNNETDSSLRLFKELLALGERANSSTIVGLIPVFFPFGHLGLTLCIHCFCVKSGMVSNPAISTALTTVYSRLNEIELARQVFDESIEKSLASWNAMISGYTQNGLTDAAIHLFQNMQTSKVQPNPVTVTSILSACAQLGALSLGKWVHNLVKREGFHSNIYMLQSGVSPSGVTFLSALYACSHAGLVTEGDRIFHSMVHDHGVEPLAEHYACMVDIFGRAGKLEKALEFIERMPVEPGPAIWGALLGACMIHKDTRLAHLASKRLFELDPENVGYYVLLSNIYSVDKNYPQAASIRQVVRRRSLAKTPGCTLIEVGGLPHVFTSGDRSHPQTKAIYAKLENLMGKMTEAGFQAETVTALHDVEDEEKELMVKVHSEKLAIAFGLISTEPGSEIRIIKNLRVCIDCHTATKFISKITGRDIVVRDANRFHHFKDGICSCGDYW
ncbi:hypothetical protein EUGRSUZ_C00245 [Eucalyptus grandis]|uniref:DYW domain-containing protein n=2 Tax=Eucalyptus grandis TaxID=71139 RepID=A0A059CKV3_EUCGR|nr:hypothetical protein EUGRSUZ_C00245 [Eucalyptus grandis]